MGKSSKKSSRNAYAFPGLCCRVSLSLFLEDTAAEDPPLGYLYSRQGCLKKIDSHRRLLILRENSSLDEVILSLDDILDISIEE